MSTIKTFAALQRLQVPAVTTADAAAVLDMSVSAASHALRTLASEGIVVPVRKGLWSLERPGDPLRLLEYVTAPWPAYVSLQSALYLHGMIEQIPVVTYAVTLGRSLRVQTTAGAYGLHHVAPEFFDGFTMHDGGFKLATPEKALVDLFYLSSTRNRAFASLPEVDWPRSFRRSVARAWVERITSTRLRTIVSQRLETLFRR